MNDAKRVDTMAYAAVWLDHREARVFRLGSQHVDKLTVRVPQHLHRRHAKGESGAKEHPDDATRFFHELAKSLDSYRHILIVGPSTAKLDFVRFVRGHHRALTSRIDGVATVDHPTDGQVAALGNRYFRLHDD
jgi:stalled ribosome rescue protein Dom34